MSPFKPFAIKRIHGRGSSLGQIRPSDKPAPPTTPNRFADSDNRTRQKKIKKIIRSLFEASK